MTLETAGAETPVADGATPEAPVENTSDATAEAQQDANEGEASAVSDTPGENSGEDAAAKEERSKRFSGRISELVRQRNEANQRAERAEARLRESEKTDISDLEYEDQIAEKTIQRSRKEQVENERAAARDLAYQAFKAREVLAADKYTDYSAVAHKGWEPTPVMLEVILDSDNGPDLAYHLGKNPGDFERIAALSPARQAAELGKLEARISAPRQLPKQPPAPITPVGGTASAGSTDPSKMSMSEFIKWREKEGG